MQSDLQEQLIKMAITYAEAVWEQEYDPEDEVMCATIDDFVSGGINVIENPLLFNLITASRN